MTLNPFNIDIGNQTSWGFNPSKIRSVPLSEMEFREFREACRDEFCAGFECAKWILQERIAWDPVLRSNYPGDYLSKIADHMAYMWKYRCRDCFYEKGRLHFFTVR